MPKLEPTPTGIEPKPTGIKPTPTEIEPKLEPKPAGIKPKPGWNKAKTWPVRRKSMLNAYCENSVLLMNLKQLGLNTYTLNY